MSNKTKQAWYDETFKGSVMLRVCMLDPIFHATIEQARKLRDQLCTSKPVARAVWDAARKERNERLP